MFILCVCVCLSANSDILAKWGLNENKPKSQKTREGCDCFGNLLGVPEDNSLKVTGQFGKHFTEARNASNGGIWVTGKANLPRTLGQHWPEHNPHLL